MELHIKKCFIQKVLFEIHLVIIRCSCVSTVCIVSTQPHKSYIVLNRLNIIIAGYLFFKFQVVNIVLSPSHLALCDASICQFRSL